MADGIRPHSGHPDHGRDEDCRSCGARLLSWCTEPDPCIGFLPGVFNACCGHGDAAEAYMTFGFTEDFDGPYLSGKNALAVMRSMRTALGDLNDERWHGGHDDPDATFEEIFGDRAG